MNKISILAVILVLSIVSCNKKNKNSIKTSQTIDTISCHESLKKIYYSMPSPMELASTIKKSKNAFSNNFLNNTNQINNYQTTKAMAINLGVYSADLGFLSIMEQTQLTSLYFSTIISLADKLQIKEGISDTILNQINNNLNNLEKLKELSAKAFFKADAYLKENDMENISTMIINGSWIESIYILTKIYQSNKDEKILRLLLDQRLVVDNILKLDSLYLQNKNITKQLVQLKQLLNSTVIRTKIKKYDPIADTMRIKTEIKYETDNTKIKKIFNKIIKIRKNFVSLH